jgi:2-polyprenyl-3-methyl-5-hydroxy-6-metoxy-1,4-benzoquinol methylase
MSLGESTIFEKEKTVSFISTKLGQFRYFDQQLGQPVWSEKRVLDFGGNCGNLLKDPMATIDEDRYWCIDVSRDGLSRGRETFPKGHWIFYNRHNFQFNPEGIKDLRIPGTREKFDFILAYSVFTHTARAEMIDLVAQLRERLTDRGMLAFTFFDPRWNAFNGDAFPGSNLNWRLQVNKVANPAMDVDSLLEKSRGAKWVTLVDDELFVEDEGEYEPGSGSPDQKAYIVFCDPEYMRTIFPDSEILPPAAPERHHCCILRRN